MQILPATEADIPDCQAIYAHHVLAGTGTFEETPPCLEEFTQRFHAIGNAGFCWLVAKHASACLGYGYYGPFRTRPAYRYTVEDSIYIRDDARNQGVGKALLTALLTHATAAGFKQMLAIIGDSENTGSIALHTTTGFSPTGTMHQVGYKFDRWLDVVIMQKALG